MLDEDVVIKSTRNTNENVLVYNVLCVLLLPVIFFGGSSELFMGLFVSLGMVAPINIINYAYTWNARPGRMVGQMLFYMLPFLAMFGITIWGICNGGFDTYELGGFTYYALSNDCANMPIFVGDKPLVAISDDLARMSAFLCGLSIFMITDSCYVIRKILIWASVLIVVLMVLGCAIMFMWKFEGTIFADSSTDFFSTFPNSAQWASFAVLWIGASMAMALFSEQRFRSFQFFWSVRFACLASACVLYFGVLIAGKLVHELSASLVMAVGMSVMAFYLLPVKMNLYRHELLLRVSSHTKRLKKMRGPFVLYCLGAIVFWFMTIVAVRDVCGNSQLLYVDESNANSITYVEKMAVVEDTTKMFSADRKLFGYGSASYPSVFSLYQGSDLGALPWKSANIDVLHEYIENGIVGFVLSGLTFLFFFIRWLVKREFSWSSVVMLLAVFCVLGMSLVEIPFQNIAVVASFWVISMSAFRWDDAKVK